tara:strand:- start:43627 stop:45102 length:1476 start_codon:yes stop_codon:yes gene_type:complete
MSKFRSASRTVVTEIKSFVVDTVARTGAFRQSVSARITETDSLDRRDINVSEEYPFIIPKDTNAVLGILSPEPVRLVLTQTGEYDLEPEPEPVPDPPAFDVSSQIYAGSTLNIGLTDSSVKYPRNRLTITAFNMRTGETEAVELNRDDEDVFRGTLQIALGEDGNDFDGVMYAESQHQILLQYHVNPDENELLETTVNVDSPYTDPAISSLHRVFPGKPIPVYVDDPDLDGAHSVSVNVLNLNFGSSRTMELSPVEGETGLFYGLLLTRSEDAPENDSAITVRVGDEVSLTFRSPYYDQVDLVEEIVLIEDSRDIDAQISVEAEVMQGGSFDIALNDYNLSGVGTTELVVSNVRTREYVLVKCRELIPHGGVFNGTVNTTLGTSDVANGLLGVEVGDVIRTTYIDSTAESMPSIRVEGDTLVTSGLAPSPAGISLMVESEQEPETEPETETKTQTVEMIVDGLFYLNGAFKGTVEVYGLSPEMTRCSILHS